MPYSDFNLRKVKDDFLLTLIEDENLFFKSPEIQISETLLATLDYNVPLAMAVGTEKARSEFIIANVLLEVRKLLLNKVSLFSGVALDVDKEKGLVGFCDFVISQSAEQFYMTAPIITIVEAKNDNIAGVLGQCIAEMVAANIFNTKEGLQLPAIYGAVTTGNTWKFLKLSDNNVTIYLCEYHISNVNKIVGVFVQMLSHAEAIFK